MKIEKGTPRIHQCLVSSCSEYLKSAGLPELYGAPVAFTMIQAIVGKRFWFRTKRGPVFLSAFRFLIGSPGIGKSMATDLVQRCLTEAKLDVPIAPSSITRASLVDELGNANMTRRVWGMDANDQISTILINASEYGVFIGPNPGDDLYRTMCELGDGRNYRETRRSLKGEALEIKSPYINMLTATQPEHFATHFPREAWKAGYASRCDFYYSEDMSEDSSFYLDYDPDEDAALQEDIEEFARTVAHDLQCIFATIDKSTAHQMKLSPEASKRFLHWCDVERIETEFTHPWLLDYNARRRFRLRKDCALFCLARGETDYVISEADVENAIAIHAKQDHGLVDLTHKIMTSDNGDILKMVHSWALRAFAQRGGRPITKAMLSEYVMTKCKLHEVSLIMRHLVDNGVMLEVTHGPSAIKGINQEYAIPQYKPNPLWSSKGDN